MSKKDLDLAINSKIDELLQEISSANVDSKRSTFEIEISIRDVDTGELTSVSGGFCITRDGQRGQWRRIGNRRVCVPESTNVVA